MNIVTKGSMERQVADLKRRMKQTRQVDRLIFLIIFGNTIGNTKAIGNKYRL